MWPPRTPCAHSAWLDGATGVQDASAVGSRAVLPDALPWQLR